MFGIDTQEKMPEAFLTDHAVWDEYMGHVWYNILSFVNFTRESSVVDIAPGSSTKLGAALAKFCYRGHLYVVDSSPEAIGALKKKYSDLLPQAQIHWLCGALEEQIKNLPQNPDYLLGNHILDDMILAAASHTPHEQKKNFSWASAYEHVPTTEFQKSWEQLLSNPPLLSHSAKAVENGLTEVIKALHPHYLILNQYPSSTLYDHGMGIVNDHAFSVLTALKELFKEEPEDRHHLQTVLNANRNFNNAHIGEHILDAKYWMLWRQKKYKKIMFPEDPAPL